MPDDHTAEKSTSHARRHRLAVRFPRRGSRIVLRVPTTLGDARRMNEHELNRLPKQTLLTIARSESLPNRSKMNKAQLARTLRKHFRSGTA